VNIMLYRSLYATMRYNKRENISMRLAQILLYYVNNSDQIIKETVSEGENTPSRYKQFACH
jgi:hypothetical protein